MEISFVNASHNKPQFYFVLQDNKVVEFDLELLRFTASLLNKSFFKFASFKIPSIKTNELYVKRLST